MESDKEFLRREISINKRKYHNNVEQLKRDFAREIQLMQDKSISDKEFNLQE